MKALLAAIITLAATATAAPCRFIATWGGPLVEWYEPSTGQRWTCSYADFFKYCGKKHPREMGIKVLGSLPQTRQQAPALALAAPKQTARGKAPAPQIEAESLPRMTGREVANSTVRLLPPAMPEKVTLAEAFASMATGLPPEHQDERIIIEPEPLPDEPRVQQLYAVAITGAYDVRRRAIVTASRLDAILEGKLAGQGAKIIEAARQYKLCPIFLAAVAIHESCNGKSKIVRERNNAFGLCPGGSYARYDDIESNIEAAARLLGGKGYAGGSRHTIASIQPKYCPIGDNDPKGLNKHWTTGVIHHMKSFLGPTLQVVASN